MPGKDAFKSDHYSKSVVMIYTEVSLVDATFCVKWLARLNIFIHADILVLVSEFNGGYFIVSVCHFRLIPQLGMFAIDFLTEYACIYIYIYIYLCKGYCLFM